MDGMRLCALAHDMRAPVSAIAALSQLIAAHAEDAAAVRRDAKRLETACAQLLALSQEMAEPDRPRAPVQRTPRALAQEALSIFGERIALQLSGTCDQPIAVEERAVCRILQNLLGNAVRYTPEGGAIWLEVRADADFVRFTVRDTGIGMGEGTLARLFQPYARGREAERAGIPGTGLGLYASRMLAREMGGEIAVQSREGEGSAFTFALPRAEPGAVLAGRRFLVAEDNLLAGDALCELLEAFGACAARAADGREALRLFEESEEGAFDAVLMDVQMPGMDGLEAARAIRRLKRPDATRVTIIALTGDASRRMREKAAQSGADFCVLKPLGMQTLARMLVCAANSVDKAGAS